MSYYDLPREIPSAVNYESEFQIYLSGEETVWLARKLFGDRFWGGRGNVSRAWLGEALLTISDYRKTNLDRGEKSTATRLENALQSQYQSQVNWYIQDRKEAIQALRHYANYVAELDENTDWELVERNNDVCVSFKGGEIYEIRTKLILEGGTPKVVYSVMFSEAKAETVEALAEALKQVVLERRAEGIQNRLKKQEKALELLNAYGIPLTEEVA